jgi:RsmE family RNA methyltransferase
MNLVLLFQDDFLDNGRARLKGRRLEHISSVHRAKVGGSLRVGLLGGNTGTGHITALDKDLLEMEVCLNHTPPAKLPLEAVIALPRPKALNRTMVAATSMGVASIVLMNAWRVEKSYWKSPRLHDANLLLQRVLGLEQAADTVLPELRLARFFAPFVQDELALKQGMRLVAHPYASAPCPQLALEEPCTLVLGPEGGFISEEMAALERAGFQAISLGARILRVETALAALVSRLYPAECLKM